jgi:hypothetical protein
MSVGPEQKVDQPAYFGGSEISIDVCRSAGATDANAVDPIGAETISPDESLLRALHAAERFDGSGFYKSGRERLTPTLEVAYALVVEIKNGGEAATRFAVDHLSRARKRKISSSKIELIALELTAKPQSESERKLCSSHASILKVARGEGVLKEQFAEWFLGQKVKDCRSRATRKARPKVGSTKPPKLERLYPANPDDYPTLRLGLWSGEALLAEHVVLASMSGPRVGALARLLDSDQAVSSLLRALAEMFEQHPNSG